VFEQTEDPVDATEETDLAFLQLYLVFNGCLAQKKVHTDVLHRGKQRRGGREKVKEATARAIPRAVPTLHPLAFAQSS
jgi:hypothetical protein